MTLDCKYIGIRKSEIAARTQLLSGMNRFKSNARIIKKKTDKGTA